MSDKTPADIEKELRETRAQMTDTVDQLVAALDPRESINRVKTEAKYQAQDLQDTALDTLDDARQGDRRAIAIVAGVAVGTLLIGGLVLRKLFK